LINTKGKYVCTGLFSTNHPTFGVPNVGPHENAS
jgi:hypothetical protein